MLLVKPTIECNRACKYCYEDSYRSRKIPIEINIDKIIEVIKETKQENIGLHGGEPLILPKDDVYKILKAIYEKIGKSGIQTNGTLIDSDHIKMFKEFKTNVGISFDGYEDLNEYRASLAETSRIYDLIKSMRQDKIQVSIIVVVSKANAGTPEKLEKLKRFIKEATALELSGRINPCFTSNRETDLDSKSLSNAYSELFDYLVSNGLRWSPFSDMWNSVIGNKEIVCVYTGCDLFHTQSCEVVLGDGTITNCMRVSEKGIYLRHPALYKTRFEVLTQVTQENYGCKGCEFWNFCHGGCPTHGIDNDWRNRTQLCEMYKTIFSKMESLRKFIDAKRVSCQDNPSPQKNQSNGHSDGIDHLDGSIKHTDGWR
jgi:uncharacterized protein